ncbi:hypothetical protein K492DRAFT_18219 [Lichtheimia hyalospora FSU 10163]|nr:hypothetical protein K492DRAFT_18219 [Lichtheimia hyalospora FSU 10163]
MGTQESASTTMLSSARYMGSSHVQIWQLHNNSHPSTHMHITHTPTRLALTHYSPRHRFFFVTIHYTFSFLHLLAHSYSSFLSVGDGNVQATSQWNRSTMRATT